MKILFLQFWYDLYGGIETVNDTLATQFNKDGYDTSILCLWRTSKNEYVDSSEYSKSFINNEPKRPSYKQMIKDFTKLKFKTNMIDLKKSIKYYFQKFQDEKNFSKKIKSIDPDFIIVSNPMLVDFVPKEYLTKTVIHMHTGMQYYYEDSKFTKKILKYNTKINRFIWLSNNAALESEKLGFSNNLFINNPVRFKNETNNLLTNKTITYVGRISAEKRVDKLIEIFDKSNLAEENWTLNIYGSGDNLEVDKYKNINMCGSTNNVREIMLGTSVFALTSKYEGFSMVTLEAYECGVPVICYDYGVTAVEVIQDGKTGFIIQKDNEEEYIQKLRELCLNLSLRQQMGEEAKKNSKKYYPEIIVKKWYKLFKGEI